MSSFNGFPRAKPLVGPTIFKRGELDSLAVTDPATIGALKAPPVGLQGRSPYELSIFDVLSLVQDQ